MRRTHLLLAIALGSAVGMTSPALAQGDEAEGDTPIQHAIIVYQDNISSDHYCGTFGHGSAGIPAGVQLFHTTPSGTQLGPYAPFRLDGLSQPNTCDVDHEYWDMVGMTKGGRMDRYLQFGNGVTAPDPGTTGPFRYFEIQHVGHALEVCG